MYCLICGSNRSKTIYDGYIRNGGIGTLTDRKYKMHQCLECKTIWHEIDQKKIKTFYQSRQYREELEHSANVENYYKLHDKEVLEKLEYTGTDLYRNATVADIGCAGGSFLDFISGVADKIIAIEPSEEYRLHLSQKGYKVYAYASDAMEELGGKMDLVTSFDVIEHVSNPIDFMKDVYGLMKHGGTGIIGTPSNCPVMCSLLGNIYEQKLLYSVQHPWILSEESLKMCCQKAGFSNIVIKQKQRYGLENLIGWLREQKPGIKSSYDFVTDTLNVAYKSELESNNMADYLVAYVKK